MKMSCRSADVPACTRGAARSAAHRGLCCEQPLKPAQCCTSPLALRVASIREHPHTAPRAHLAERNLLDLEAVRERLALRPPLRRVKEAHGAARRRAAHVQHGERVVAHAEHAAVEQLGAQPCKGGESSAARART